MKFLGNLKEGQTQQWHAWHACALGMPALALPGLAGSVAARILGVTVPGIQYTYS
jgi:hypothetical protein